MTDQIVRRRSIRAAGYDYTSPGAYFVTICSYEKRCLFATIVQAESRLNEYGNIVDECWRMIPHHFLRVELDDYIIMPTHMHGIILIRGENEPVDSVGAQHAAPHGVRPDVDSVGAQHAAPLHVNRQFGDMTPGSLSTIVRSYKSAVTKMINKSRNTPGRSVWQRNFHEHIIRNEAEMNLIREYIQNNPLKWAESRRGAACCAPTVKPRFDWMLHD